MAGKARHVFGPVPSRRLGRSLGVDLVPHKTCTYDCIYCQLGPTTNCTVAREPYVSIPGVLQEIEQKLAASPPPDYITLSGSGEPTLQVGLGALILGIKRLTTQPVAVLTNGALLWRDDVQKELLDADLVIPSLDAGDDETFQRVNRPHPQLHFEDVVEGLVDFRRRFKGQFWLEVFLLDGLTATDAQLEQLAALAERIAPERIQLNTVARPPTEPDARPAKPEDLDRAARRLGPGAEVIAETHEGNATTIGAVRPEDIVDLLRRRPCTLDDLAAGLGAHRLEVAKHVERLLRGQDIVMRQHGQRVFYRANGGDAVDADEYSPEQRGPACRNS